MTGDPRDNVIHHPPAIQYNPIMRESLILALLQMCNQLKDKPLIPLYNAAQILRLGFIAEERKLIVGTLAGLREWEGELKNDMTIFWSKDDPDNPNKKIEITKREIVKQSINMITKMMQEKEAI